MTEPWQPDWRAVKLHVAVLTGDAATWATIQTFDDRHQDGRLAGWRHGRLSDPEMQKWMGEKPLGLAFDFTAIAIASRSQG
jgi:hypothetical protein